MLIGKHRQFTDYTKRLKWEVYLVQLTKTSSTTCTAKICTSLSIGALGVPFKHNGITAFIWKLDERFDFAFGIKVLIAACIYFGFRCAMCGKKGEVKEVSLRGRAEKRMWPRLRWLSQCVQNTRLCDLPHHSLCAFDCPSEQQHWASNGQPQLHYPVVVVRLPRDTSLFG